MAPEVICKMNHSFPVDFFALGVIAYEFMTGRVIIYSLRDHILERIENKLEKKYWLNKFSWIRFHLMDGVEKVWIL